MKHPRQPDSSKPHPVPLYAALPNPAAVFPGKPYLMDLHPGNLAVKRSLQDIFDEFSQVISGELKSMNMDEFEAEHRQNRRKQD